MKGCLGAEPQKRLGTGPYLNRPCAFDVYNMRLVDNLVLEALDHNNGLRALALINQASTNHISQEASTVVGERVAFQRTSSVGMTVAEFARPTDRGVREMAGLYQGVFGDV